MVDDVVGVVIGGLVGGGAVDGGAVGGGTVIVNADGRSIAVLLSGSATCVADGSPQAAATAIRRTTAGAALRIATLCAWHFHLASNLPQGAAAFDATITESRAIPLCVKWVFEAAVGARSGWPVTGGSGRA